MTTPAAIAVLAAFLAASLPAAALAAEPEAEKRMIEPLTLAAYLKDAAVGDMFEIRSSELALERAQRPQVKDFAQRMLRDHKKSTAMLKQAASADGLPADTRLELPKSMDPKHEKLLQDLAAVPAGEFDRKYLEVQLAAHQQALKLHESYAQSGDVESVRKTAGEIAQVVKSHVEELQRLTSARAPETSRR